MHGHRLAGLPRRRSPTLMSSMTSSACAMPSPLLEWDWSVARKGTRWSSRVHFSASLSSEAASGTCSKVWVCARDLEHSNWSRPGAGAAALLLLAACCRSPSQRPPPHAATRPRRAGRPKPRCASSESSSASPWVSAARPDHRRPAQGPPEARPRGAASSAGCGSARACGWRRPGQDERPAGAASTSCTRPATPAPAKAIRSARRRHSPSSAIEPAGQERPATVSATSS